MDRIEKCLKPGTSGAGASTKTTILKGGPVWKAIRSFRWTKRYPFNLLDPLSIQHMFAMFGASVLVPFLFGIKPAMVLFMNGVGTLLFIVITKGKAPAYLGSSFAFLAPAGMVIAKFRI